jgi:hypothetical protein
MHTPIAHMQAQRNERPFCKQFDEFFWFHVCISAE